MHTETNHAQENAAAWMDNIVSFALAINPESWDRREELQDQVNDEAANLPGFRKSEALALALTSDEAKELADLNAALDEYRDADEARERVEESALSVELSGTWEPGATPEADRFIILLSTGGPALRIVGNLGWYNSPEDPELEYQDWGTPWTRYYGDNLDREALEAFCNCFYFGE